MDKEGALGRPRYSWREVIQEMKAADSGSGQSKMEKESQDRA